MIFQIYWNTRRRSAVFLISVSKQWSGKWWTLSRVIIKMLGVGVKKTTTIHRDSLSNYSGEFQNRFGASFLLDMWWRWVWFRNTSILLASSHTLNRAFCKIIFHKVWKGWSELQGHSRASLHRMRCERHMLWLDVHLKCAVSPVCIFLTNALRSHHLCGLECSGLIYFKY